MVITERGPKYREAEPTDSPAKIAIIGAGSADFTWKLADQLFAHPTLAHAEIALCDIDPRRLRTANRLVETIAQRYNVTPHVSATLDRRDAIRGSTVVINTIRVGGYSATELDFDIPEKYRLEQTVGDTAGIGGIMLAARTLPVVKGILRDMEELAPDALFLNHTNPLATMVLGAHQFSPDIKTYGLCHSVDETAKDLAKYLKKPVEELEYETAGINHMAFFLTLMHQGKDMYPALFEAMKDPDIWKKDAVRFELMRFFRFFITESSDHSAEYVPYFLRPDREHLVQSHGIKPRFYLRRLQLLRERREQTEQDPGMQIDEEQTREYGPLIVDALLTGNHHKIVLTVPNDHEYIRNLPRDSAVEVSCLVDGSGVHPDHFGDLPIQLVGLIQPHITVQQLVVEAIDKEDPDSLIQAALLDPRTYSILELDQITAMMRELFEAHEAHLPKGFAKKSVIFSQREHEKGKNDLEK